MKRLIQTLVVLSVLLTASSLCLGQSCQKCVKASCVTGTASGGCQCSSSPCVTCGVCALICVFPCEGGGSTGQALGKAGFQSMSEVRAAWQASVASDKMLDVLDTQGFNVLAALIRAERYVLNDDKRPCGALVRSGSFSLIDFKNPQKDDPTADWESTITPTRAEYRITDQPDTMALDKLVILADKWQAYRGQTLVAEGILGDTLSLPLIPEGSR